MGFGFAFLSRRGHRGIRKRQSSTKILAPDRSWASADNPTVEETPVPALTEGDRMAPDPVAARGDSSGANGDGDADVEGNPAVRLHSHAFALNLPSHCRGADGVPHVTRYAEKKARDILKLVRSLVLTEEALLSHPSQAGEGAEAMDIEAAGDGGDRNTAKGPPSMVRANRSARNFIWPPALS